jgi:hypothetical protein
MTRTCVGLGLVAVVALAGCGGNGEPEGTGYVLLDRSAREAGFVVEGAAETSRVLPLEVDAADELTLVGPTGRTPLSTAPGELLHVRGGTGLLESNVIGEDVDLNRLRVDGSEDAARVLAQALGGSARQASDGTWEIEGDRALVEAARLAGAPQGLVEALPSTLIDDLEAAPTMNGREGVPGAGEPLLGANPRQIARVSNLMSSTAGLEDEVTCADPVAGTWVSSVHDPRFTDWYTFTLKIRRVLGSSTEVVGEIVAHSWSGGPDQALAPEKCEGNNDEFTVEMSARGTVLGDVLEFNGTSWRVDKRTCGWSPGDNEYNLDRFRGSVDNSRFASLNNDGGRMIDEPTPFRRVSCR